MAWVELLPPNPTIGLGSRKLISHLKAGPTNVSTAAGGWSATGVHDSGFAIARLLMNFLLHESRLRKRWGTNTAAHTAPCGILFNLVTRSLIRRGGMSAKVNLKANHHHQL